MSNITFKLTADSELHHTPHVNRDNHVDFMDNDIENPRNWSPARKRYITAMVVLLSLNGSIASSITSGSTESIRDEFGVSQVTVQLKKDWHWGMYACLWLGSFSMALMFTIPETHSSTVLVQRARRARQQGHDVQAEVEASSLKLLQLYKTALTQPWVLLFDPICFLCCVYSCVVSALQYMLFTIYPLAFRDIRGWNAAVSQLPLLGQAVGAVFGLIMVFGLTKRLKNKTSLGRDIVPEDHMVLAMMGGVGFPISMLWLSWSAQYHSIHWIVPAAGGTVLATCLMLIHVSCCSYISDTYADYAASAFATNMVARCLSSAGAPLFTAQMFNAMGIGSGGSLIAGMAALLATTPFLFYHYGHIIRSRSKYALD